MLLYDYALSGNCYKIRLFLAVLGQGHDSVAVDFYPGQAHKHPDFLDINPAGTLPVLIDGDVKLCDSQAILVYLARRYDPSGAWFPIDDGPVMGRVQQWLAFSARLTDTAGQARLGTMLGRPVDIEAARSAAHRALRELEAHLTEREFDGSRFLVTDHPTVADIACFPYAALSPDGGIEHDEYPALRRWLLEMRRLPGFIVMPGIPPLHDRTGNDAA